MLSDVCHNSERYLYSFVVGLDNVLELLVWRWAHIRVPVPPVINVVQVHDKRLCAVLVSFTMSGTGHQNDEMNEILWETGVV